MNEKLLRNYAKLIVTMGAALEKGQPVVIRCDVQDAYFGRMVADAAYDVGAKEVEFLWLDSYSEKQRYLRAEDAIFDEFPQWRVDRFKHFDDQKAAYISIISDDPELLKGVDPDKIQRTQIAGGKATKAHRELMMGAVLRWTVAAVPSEAWAKKVFPNESAETAVQKLWEAIAKCSRIDNDDPIAAWKKHSESFIERSEYMNQKQFRSLHITNSLGTDVIVELPEQHRWMGGGENSKDGKYFLPNIPTEELFSLPKRTGVNGKIVSSMPLVYRGNAIEGIELEFENGRVVSYKAATNEPLLKTIIETDEGSHYLGEIALVPFDSPISNMNILFYNTLFDENASCHFALGKAYPSCLQNSEHMSDEELLAKGVNDSLTHVDFMFGSADLKITGTDQEGNAIDIFADGNFMI